MPYVARDMDGELVISNTKPIRQKTAWWTKGTRAILTWWKPGCGWADPFPEVKWESEPVKVDILLEEAS